MIGKVFGGSRELFEAAKAANEITFEEATGKFYFQKHAKKAKTSFAESVEFSETFKPENQK
eukprot:14291624-Alexandrium_andersonii.AAC.1